MAKPSNVKASKIGRFERVKLVSSFDAVGHAAISKAILRGDFSIRKGWRLLDLNWTEGKKKSFYAVVERKCN